MLSVDSHPPPTKKYAAGKQKLQAMYSRGGEVLTGRWECWAAHLVSSPGWVAVLNKSLSQNQLHCYGKKKKSVQRNCIFLSKWYILFSFHLLTCPLQLRVTEEKTLPGPWDSTNTSQQKYRLVDWSESDKVFLVHNVKGINLYWNMNWASILTTDSH